MTKFQDDPVQLNNAVMRITRNGLYVDLIKTSQGLIRIGSMPDISKIMKQYGLCDEIVVVPPWRSSMAGDNHTGEEFVLWDAQVKNSLGKTYVGLAQNVNLMHGNLNKTFSFFFDSSQTRVIKKHWLKKWFKKEIAAPDFQKGDLSICFKNSTITAIDQGVECYDKKALEPGLSPDAMVEDILAGVTRDSAKREDLEITPVGIGNGFVGTSSACLVRYGNRALWIDPCGYPAHMLSKYGIHWDDITDIFITHNHEDHIQGLSACLARARIMKKPLRLITAKSIYKVIKHQFSPLYPEFNDLVQWISISPGTPLMLGKMQLETRWNHHILPYGTLGLKIFAGGKRFGFSGDTKLDEKLNLILKREELFPQWFASCDLVFHEVEFDSPSGVHTHWKALEKLQQSIPCEVLGYHTGILPHLPIPLAKEGRTYRLQ
ncbi:MAG: ribonuclease Z [Desulfobacteraceae bacterium]|nr:ribonuclease Z [Desulfobacteraceae bacterium]